MTQKYFTSFGMKNTLYWKEKKTNSPHWFITLLRLRDDSLLKYNPCLQLKWQMQQNWVGKEGRPLPEAAESMLCFWAAQLQMWKHTMPLHLKWAIPMHSKLAICNTCVCKFFPSKHTCWWLWLLETFHNLRKTIVLWQWRKTDYQSNYPAIFVYTWL